MRFIQIALILVFTCTGMAQAQTTFEDAYESLDSEKQIKFERILAAHGIIKSSTHTMNMMRDAVESCATHHPDMKATLTQDFKALDADITNILRKARGALKRTLQLEEVLPRDVMKAYLNEIDEEALKTHEKTPIVPLQRLEDCERFQKKVKSELETDRLKATLNKVFGFEAAPE